MAGYQPLTLEDLWQGHDTEYEVTPKLYANSVDLINAINTIGELYYQETGRQIRMGYGRSGWRPGIVNQQAGGAKKSAHITCEAIDLADGDGSLDKWLMGRLDWLWDIGIRELEHPDSTPGWSHISIRHIYNQTKVLLIRPR